VVRIDKLANRDGSGDIDLPDYVGWVVVEWISYCNNYPGISGGEIKSLTNRLCAPKGFSVSEKGLWRIALITNAQNVLAIGPPKKLRWRIIE
jgi:hypothetical protein